MRNGRKSRPMGKPYHNIPRFGLHDTTDKRERESEQKTKTKIVNVAEKTFWS